MSRKKIIGTNALTYPELRNFAELEFEDFEFRKVLDAYKFPAYILYKFKNKINRKWQNSFSDFGFNSCDFFHFFNVISIGSKPFITTYETALPRWRDTDEDFRAGLKLIAKDNCKAIIALSQCAYKRQETIVHKYAAELSEAIRAKNMVLLPPQIPFIDSIDEKRKPSETIVFTIVGADFFRKGGKAILQAFDHLLALKENVNLNIVSTLNYGDYASKTTRTDYDEAIAIIRKYPEHIKLFQKLGNTEVKQLLLETDVALLPSLAETFGYFILEAQAAGCPVITTDIRAMPEINNTAMGWIINTRMQGSDDADISKPGLLNDKITEQLVAIIESITNDLTIIKTKGQLALQNIIENHSPTKHRESLMKLYNSI